MYGRFRQVHESGDFWLKSHVKILRSEMITIFYFRAKRTSAVPSRDGRRREEFLRNFGFARSHSLPAFLKNKLIIPTFKTADCINKSKKVLFIYLIFLNTKFMSAWVHKAVVSNDSCLMKKIVVKQILKIKQIK